MAKVGKTRARKIIESLSASIGTSRGILAKGKRDWEVSVFGEPIESLKEHPYQRSASTSPTRNLSRFTNARSKAWGD